VRSVSHHLHVADRHWRDGRGKILTAIAAGWALSIGVRLAYPVMLPYLQSAYGLTLTTAGLLLSVLWIAYALGQLPGGLLADRIGEGTTMVLSMALAAGTLTLVIVGASAPLLFVATTLFGFATALFGVVRITAISAVYPDRIGTAFGLISAAGDVGNTLFPPAAGLVAAVLAWQLGFGLAVPMFALVAVAIWVVVPARTSDETASDGFSIEAVRYLVGVLRERPILLALAVQIVGVSVWNAFTGFFPTYLIDVKGLSATVAGGVFALYFALGILVKPFSGNAYDRVGARTSLVLICLVSGAGLVVLTIVEGFWPIVAVTALLSAMLGRGTITLSYLTVALADDVLNTGLGTLRTVYMTVGAASPLAFGAIADLGYFDEAFLLLAVLTVLSIPLVLRLPEV
jgi:MFS family permease